MDESDPVPESVTIPLKFADGEVSLTTTPGEVTVIVGGNGSGKSALMQRLALQLFQLNSGAAAFKHILSQRRVWLPGSGPSLNALDREHLSQNIRGASYSATVRWRDDYEAQRPEVAVYDLLAKTNVRNADAVTSLKAGRTEEASELATSTPLDSLNQVLASGRLSIKLELNDIGGFDAVESSGKRYPFNRTSDGERNAVLLAAEVITAEPRTILLIDEPERHLHRSISCALVQELLLQRPDCHFVVSTHDLELAESLVEWPGQRIVLERCEWGADGEVSLWHGSSIESGESFPEPLRAAIVGGRRRSLFVEGTQSSVDRTLLALLLPAYTVVPAGGSAEVTRSVKGVRDTEALHRIHAVGVVDRDRRDQAEIDDLLASGVTVLRVHEAENLLYTEPCLLAVAELTEALGGLDAEAAVRTAIESGLLAFEEPGVVDRIAAQVAVERMRRQVLEEIPSPADLTPDPALTVALDNPYAEEVERLADIVKRRDYQSLLSEYPVRETGFRANVARTFELKRYRYEQAVLASLRRSSDLRAELLRLSGLEHL